MRGYIDGAVEAAGGGGRELREPRGDFRMGALVLEDLPGLQVNRGGDAADALGLVEQPAFHDHPAKLRALQQRGMVQVPAEGHRGPARDVGQGQGSGHRLRCGREGPRRRSLQHQAERPGENVRPDSPGWRRGDEVAGRAGEWHGRQRFPFPVDLAGLELQPVLAVDELERDFEARRQPGLTGLEMSGEVGAGLAIEHRVDAVAEADAEIGEKIPRFGGGPAREPHGRRRERCAWGVGIQIEEGVGGFLHAGLGGRHDCDGSRACKASRCGRGRLRKDVRGDR